MPHDAEYFRLRRRAQGIPERDPITNPRFVTQGRELAGMLAAVECPALPWPAGLFGDSTIAELMADGDFAPAKIGTVLDKWTSAAEQGGRSCIPSFCLLPGVGTIKSPAPPRFPKRIENAPATQ